MRKVGFFCCPYCGSLDVHPSRFRSIFEKLFAGFFRLNRCYHCMRRHFRIVLLEALRRWLVAEHLGHSAARIASEK
jgi:hypothetical protein